MCVFVCVNIPYIQSFEKLGKLFGTSDSNPEIHTVVAEDFTHFSNYLLTWEALLVPGDAL